VDACIVDETNYRGTAALHELIEHPPQRRIIGDIRLQGNPARLCRIGQAIARRQCTGPGCAAYRESGFRERRGDCGTNAAAGSSDEYGSHC
jgi:hypothetical protein